MNALSLFYSAEDFRFVCWLCQHRGDDFILSQEGQLVGDFSDVQLEIIHPDHIPYYQKLVQSIRAEGSGDQEVFELWGEYDALEKNRIACEKELGFIQEELNSLVPGEVLGNGLQKHEFFLSSEFEGLLGVEEAFLNSPLLEKCLELCFESKGQKTLSEDLRNQMRDLINSCSYRLKTAIWSQLYFSCANHAQEDQWSEKHFHTFLWPFTCIVKRLFFQESYVILNALQGSLKNLQQ